MTNKKTALATAALALALAASHATTTAAFVVPTPTTTRTTRPSFLHVRPAMTTSLRSSVPSGDPRDEAERLRSAAETLRREAAALADEQRARAADAARAAFERLDADGDGALTLDEVRAGLAKKLGSSASSSSGGGLDASVLTDDRLRRLVARFDADGDGVLSLDDFASIGGDLGGRLESMVRDERSAAREEARLAAIEGAEREAAAEARAAIDAAFNEGDATPVDRAASVLPYLLPLLDSLQFASHAVAVAGGDDSPIAKAAVAAYVAWRSSPLLYLGVFFLFSSMSNNVSLNKLVRFNLKQSIFLDVGLALASVLAWPVANFAGPDALATYDDAALAASLAVLAYCAASSLLAGAAPDGVPFVSAAVADRMVTPDMIDDEGRFVGRRDLPEGREEEGADEEGGGGGGSGEEEGGSQQ